VAGSGEQERAEAAMSTGLLSRGVSPDSNVVLVKKISEKTRQGKITWHKARNGLTAYVPGKLRITFVETPFAALFTPRWVVFMVRDEAENEVLKVENQIIGGAAAEPDSESAAAVFSLLLVQDPLVNAARELHAWIHSRVTKGRVERAIELLDGI
jgi:hypothetical protein